ncbi:chorismate mutase, partial [Pseudalkalibacillus decolorationis]|uniref:chorismate mutase n=1 Tax=Pseudalkalibacillus decolorationis TaxID=163879 RepID=UPI00355655F8
MSNELEVIRTEIEELSLKILDLLNQRGVLAQKIGRIKKMKGTQRFDPVRERSLLDLIAENNKGPFDTPTLQHIFKSIFQAS